MEAILLSDTHGQHAKVKLPPGDMIIHAGDITGNGSVHQAKSFMEWFASLNFPYKIFIAGNHDFCFENKTISRHDIPGGVQYLQDSSCTIEGIKFYGSPYTPDFHRWAFMKNRGRELQEKWSEIPGDTHVVITHGPPLKILDQTMHGKNVGCEDLLNRVKQLKPRVHLFGHIHEGYGQIALDGTRFINGSLLNERYELVNSPIRAYL